MLTTTELAAKCRAEIERRLAVCEAATEGPWFRCGESKGGCPCGFVFSDKGDVYVAQCYGGSNDDGVDPTPIMVKQFANAAFIAASRNQRPGELRALLAVLNSILSFLQVCDTPEMRDMAEVTVREMARGLRLLEDK